MSRNEWTAGSHHLLLLDGLAVLLSADVPQEQVVQMWDALGDSGTVEGLGEVLDVLRSVTGRGLGSLPGFAMSVTDERGLHVAARGSFNVGVTTADGSQVVRGDEASLWVERNFDPATVADVVLATDDPSGTWLPVVGGVLPAGAVRQSYVDRVPFNAADAPGVPAAEAQPVPETPVAPVAEPVRARAGETWVESDADDRPEQVDEGVAGPAAQADVDELEDDVPGVDVPRVDALGDEVSEAAEVVQPAQGRFSSLLSPHTVMHDVEEAAVRPDDDDPAEPAEQDVPEQPVPAPVAQIPTPSAPAAPRPAEPTPPAAAAAAASPSFISGVPSRSAPAPAVPVSAPAPPAPAPAVEDEGPEHHDGHTMFEAPDSTELDAYLADGPPVSDADSVLGVMCPAGHGNPTHRTECRVCGQRLTGDSVRFARPGLGWMHTSAGESIELVQNVLAGRNPRASRIQGTVMPRLLPLPHSHVSGTHLEIRLEGWSVMVADLGSTNGTFLQRHGQPTVRISETPQLLRSDDVIQLGHGVDLRFEALP